MTRQDAYREKLISRSELINNIFDDFEAELSDLKNRTCKSCKYLKNSDTEFCVIHNFWLTKESIMILNCNKYEGE